jgi:hypothetical protein
VLKNHFGGQRSYNFVQNGVNYTPFISFCALKVLKWLFFVDGLHKYHTFVQFLKKRVITKQNYYEEIIHINAFGSLCIDIFCGWSADKH